MFKVPELDEGTVRESREEIGVKEEAAVASDDMASVPP